VSANEENESPEMTRMRERVRASAPAFPLDGADALFGAVQGAVARETGLAAKLRAARTPVRIAIGLGVGAVVAALAALLMVRPDVAIYPRGRFVAELAALATLLAVAIVVALRPVHRPPLPTMRARVLDLAALLAVVVVAVLPQVLDFHFDLGVALLTGCACLSMGTAAGAAQYGILRVLDRGAPGSRLAAAAAGGLTANLFLHIHCPAGDPRHTLLGHVGASVVLIAFAAWTALRRGDR